MVKRAIRHTFMPPPTAGRPADPRDTVLMVEAARSTVRVVKRKWDGTISAVDTAYRLTSLGDSAAWLVLAGSLRERPASGAIQVVRGDELWVTVPGQWWVVCARTDAGSLSGYKVHAAAAFETPRIADEIVWVDLDLDLEITGEHLEIEDESQFHDHAHSMGYPQEIVRGAWSGISTIAALYTNRDWPFNGAIETWVQHIEEHRGPTRVDSTARQVSAKPDTAPRMIGPGGRA